MNGDNYNSRNFRRSPPIRTPGPQSNFPMQQVPLQESNKKIWIFVGIFAIVVIALSIFFFIKYSSNTISNDELSAGTYIDLNEDKEVKFKLGEEEHKIIIDSVINDSIDIIIQSETIIATLNIGETKKFDLDGNETYDLLVKLKSIVDGKANLFIKKINEVICTEDWNCTEWSGCVNETQTRVCTDLNDCGTEEDKPERSQSCEIVCVENWNCTEWSGCVNETQTRVCTDLNDCGTEEDKPEGSQSCEIVCVENWNCTEWSGCVNETQTRVCTDLNDCGTEEDKPEGSQSCEIVTAGLYDEDPLWVQCGDDHDCYYDAAIQTNNYSKCFNINVYWDNEDYDWSDLDTTWDVEYVVGTCIEMIAMVLEDCDICEHIKEAISDDQQNIYEACVLNVC